MKGNKGWEGERKELERGGEVEGGREGTVGNDG